MKTIGLLGGMSWESSLEYYRLINELTAKKLGGFHSAKSVMVSVDFAEIETLQASGDWEKATILMQKAAQQVEAGGADFLVICTNTMHKMAGEVQATINIPLLHIADPTADAVKLQGLTRIGLLGTAFTMEQDFYKGRLIEIHDLDVIIPGDNDRQVVHDIIYGELVKGIVLAESRQAYVDIINRLVAQGAQGVILGCTEIMLLIQPEHSPVPVFDTTELHAAAAVDLALEEMSGHNLNVR